jgi:hypothetical protein
MQIFSPHKEILPTSQQEVWPKLSDIKRLGFVLYGGTAIALQLGHRISIDFDFFSSLAIQKRELYDQLPFLSNSVVVQDEPHSLTVLINNTSSKISGVKVSFFWGLQMGRVSEPLITKDEVLQVASLDDLLANKLKVILQRAEFKDYFDIASLLKFGMKLDEGLGYAQALFGHTFAPSESIKALNYFGDGDLYLLSKEDKELLIKESKSINQVPLKNIVSRNLSTI